MTFKTTFWGEIQVFTTLLIYFQASAETGDQEEAETNTESENDEVDELPQEKQVATTKKSTKPRKRLDSEDDGDDWEKYQEEFKKENSLDTKKKESWPVHCPYFPEVIHCCY